MAVKVILNPFTGTLTLAEVPELKSIPLEVFNNDDSEYSGAVEAYEYNQQVYKFSQGSEQTIRMRFKVPEAFTSGKLRLAFVVYSPSIVNDFKFSLRSILANQGVDAVASVGLYNDFDSGVITLAAPSQLLTHVFIDINDSTFKIGGSSIIAGSLVDLRLKRETLVSGDDSADIRVIPHIEVVKT